MIFNIEKFHVGASKETISTYGVDCTRCCEWAPNGRKFDELPNNIFLEYSIFFSLSITIVYFEYQLSNNPPYHPIIMVITMSCRVLENQFMNF